MRSLFDLIDDCETIPATAPVVPNGPSRLLDRIVPRPYQADALAEFNRAYDDGARHFLDRLATGCGKTLTAALQAEAWLARDPERRRVLVLACEQDLVHQLRREFNEALDQYVGLEMGQEGAVDARRLPAVTVASRASLYVDPQGNSRLFKFHNTNHDWLVVCDEAQLYAYSLPSMTHIAKWFEENPASAFLGLSATPKRGDKKSLARLFGHVCVELRLSDAVNEGWLVPFRQRFVQVEEIDFTELGKVKGDFDADEIDRIIREDKPLAELVLPLLEEAGPRRTIAFWPGVASAEAGARRINAEIAERGLPYGHAVAIHGGTPKLVRRDVLRRHKAGEFQYLCVCDLCRMGYDDPGIECVATFRPTKSITLAEQMKGRGARPARGVLHGLHTAEERRAAIAASKKPCCLVLDMVGISGMPEVASTAHLFAEGLPDEVAERANKIVAAAVESGEDVSVEVAVERARRDVEELEKARQAREAKEHAEAEEARKRARLRAEARYTARDVEGPQDGGARHQSTRATKPPTEKMIRRLVSYGLNEKTVRSWSIGKAGAVLSRYAKNPPSRTQGSVARDVAPDGPPIAPQLRVLERHGKPTPRTFAEAANLIRDLNRELSQR